MTSHATRKYPPISPTIPPTSAAGRFLARTCETSSTPSLVRAYMLFVLPAVAVTPAAVPRDLLLVLRNQVHVHQRRTRHHQRQQALQFVPDPGAGGVAVLAVRLVRPVRSEERRVGKEGRSRGPPWH